MRKTEVQPDRYTRDQLAVSKRYRGQRDLVISLLKEDKEYSLQEVDAALLKYKKGKVK